MQYFRDTETLELFAFEDDVTAARGAHGWTFIGPDGATLMGPYPSTLEPTNDTAPLPYVTTLAELQGQRDAFLQLATLRIAPLQDAVDIGDATSAEEAQLLAWKKYRVAVNRLDLSVTPVGWPDQPV